MPVPDPGLFVMGRSQKAIGLFFLVLLTSAGSLPAAENFHLSIFSNIALNNGQINEIVFPAETTDNPYFSRLEWQLRNVVLLGLGVRIRFLEKFSFQTSVYSNLSTGFGLMENYDWKSPSSSDHTHYSKSNAILDNLGSWQVDSTLSYEFLTISYFSFAGGLGFNFQRWSFHDELVSYKYPASVGNSLDSFIGKTTVNYTVLYFFPQVLLSLAFTYKRFGAQLLLSYGFLALTDATDYHEARDIRFRDSIFPGNYLNAGLTTFFQATKVIRINLGLSYRAILENRGYTVIENQAAAENRVLENRSGNSGEWFNIELGVEFSVWRNP
ncbi:omptin family outer membrane protease [Candidatus Haliotispira prima]|uniref:Omptin family outer membrane protease n=1 Tax=Candidatus Haliotispira prima TaxID=3034016 RepID=A0ABY8MG94_9SPIO|nr:omptin family outer membrane protease [Candidatus Haliotispira prima]